MSCEHYERWIAEHVTEGHGKCAEVTQQMATAFPELRRVRGHFVSWLDGPRPHWWLVTPNGAIVDPTRSQFIGGGDYEPWDESQPEPTGKCPNCGEYVYNGQTCHDECADAYARYCMTGFL